MDVFRRLVADSDVFRREVADSRRWSTIPSEFTNALRRFSPQIDELPMEVAVSRCGSTIPIEFTHGLRHFSISRKRGSTIPKIPNGIHDSLIFLTNIVDRRVTNDFAVSRHRSTIF